MPHKWLIATLLILTELTLCAGMVVAVSPALSRFRQSGVRLHLFQFDRFPAEADEESTFTVAAPPKLDITNQEGIVTVQGGSTNNIIVRAHKKAWGSSPTEAQAALAALKPIFTQTGATVTVSSTAQPVELALLGSNGTPSIDFTITVPISTVVTARNSFGALTVSDLTGTADLRTTNGSIHAANLTGNVTLHSTFGSITAEHITGGTFAADSDNGALTLNDVKAKDTLTLATNFGAILLRGGSAASVNAKSNNGGITLTDLLVQDAVTAASSFGSLSLKQVQAASYDLHTTNGKITVDGARHPPSQKRLWLGCVVTNGSQVNVNLHSNNGSVLYSGTLGTAPNTLTTNFGSVELNLPPDSALTVDLKTNFGQVHSAFPITSSGSSSDNSSKHWSGAINGGGALLTATSNNGSINLNLLNP